MSKLSDPLRTRPQNAFLDPPDGAEGLPMPCRCFVRTFCAAFAILGTVLRAVHGTSYSLLEHPVEVGILILRD